MSSENLPHTDAFISYSRRHLPVVERLADGLIKGGKDPWFDKRKDPLRGILAGSEWWPEIEQGIEAADNFVFLISPESVVSPFCNAEIAHAHAHGKRKIPLMLCDDSSEAATLINVTMALDAVPDTEVVPDGVALPEGKLKTLARRNWQRISAVQYIPFQVNGGFEQSLTELIDALAQDIDRIRALGDLQRSAASWDRQGRSPSFLLRGDALKEAEALIAESVGLDPEPSPLQRAFVIASRQDENRRRRVTTFAIIAAVLLITAAVVAAVLIQTNAERDRAFLEQEAADERANLQGTAAAAQAIIASTAVAAQQEAEEALRVALSRQLAAQAEINLDDQLDMALLLSLEANALDETIEARSSLLDGLGRSAYMRAFLHGHIGPVYDMAFSPDGRYLASAACIEEEYEGLTTCVQGGVFLWDVEANQLVDTLLVNHVGSPSSLAFSPDGRTLAVAGCHEMDPSIFGECVQGSIELWDVEARERDGSPLLGFRSENDYMGNAAGNLTFSPDGHWLASSGTTPADGWQGTITLWNMETRQPVGEPRIAHDISLSGLTFHPDGEILASYGSDDLIALWDAQTGSLIGQPLHMDTGFGGHLAFNPDGSKLALSNGEESIILWDLSARQATSATITSELGVGGPFAFSPDGKILASIGKGDERSEDNVLTLWDMESGEHIGQPLLGNTWAMTELAFSSDGRTIATGSADGTIVLWDLKLAHPLSEPLEGRQASALGIAFSPDRRLLASGGSDSMVTMWDLGTGQQVDQYQVSETGGGVTSVAFSPDGQTLVAGTFDWGNNVSLWDVQSGHPIALGMEGHSDEVFTVAFSPDGRFAASGCLDGTIIFWDPATGQPLSEPLTDIAPPDGTSMRSNDVWSIAFSPDSRMLASGRGGGDILIWDVETQQPDGEPLAGHSDTVMGLAFSPDGRILASAGGDRLIRLWDIETRELIGKPLTGHTEAVSSVSFSPDGRLLASSSWDGTIRFWDVQTRQAVGGAIIVGRDSFINAVVFSPDGQMLASSGSDSSVILWDLAKDTWGAQACTVANRNLTLMEWEHFLGDMPYRETCQIGEEPAGG
ncbi:MAG: TIR domain-containing protein [Candidatus Promineifilaceae bacterium]